MQIERDEKLQKMIEIKSQLEEYIYQNNQQIQEIIYYKDFEFKSTGLGVENVYIAKVEETPQKQQNEEGGRTQELEKLKYYIYDQEGTLMATVDEEGKLKFEEQFLQNLKSVNEEYFDLLELDNVEFELPTQLNENDLQITKEELEEKTAQKIEGQKSIEAEDDKTKKIKTAQALEIEPEEIRAISTINPQEQITDKENFESILPEAKEYEQIAVVATNGSDKEGQQFILIGIKQDGTREKLNSIEPIEGTSGDKDVISINEDGTEVTEKQVHGLLRINSNNREDGIAMSIGDYGMIDIDYVSNIMDKETRRSIPIRTREAQNQRITNQEVRENGGDYRDEVEEEGETYRKREARGVNPQSLDGIDTDQYFRENLEDIKGKITEKVEENEDLTRDELTRLIKSELNKSGLDLTNEEEKMLIEDIKAAAIDEIRGNRQRR